MSTPEKNVAELTIAIEKAAFDKAVSEAYRKNIVKMNVPGFRKGKAPRSVVEKLYGKGVFYDDALNALLPEAYEEALKESGAQVVSSPEFEVESIDDEGVTVKAKVFVKPEVEVKNYKGIEADRVLAETTDAEVEADIERVRARNSRTIDITDRAAENGDTANIDYAGYCDDKAFEGGTDTGHDLKLGSGSFIPGFEDQVVGHNIGDEFDVNVTFPEEYHAKDLAGKAAVFKVKLNSIKREELPVLDDDFAKDVSEFDTFDEYKADVKAKIDDMHAKRADAELDEKLINALLENTEVDIPAPMIDSEVEHALRDYANRLSMQGLSLDMYMKYTGATLDQLRANFRPQAERQVKTRLALEKVAALEEISYTDEELDKEYEDIAKGYNIEVEKIKNQIDADMLGEDIRVRKAIELIRAEAKVTQKTEEQVKAEEAAKKAAEEAAKEAGTEETTEEKPADKPAKKTTRKKTAKEESKDAE